MKLKDGVSGDEANDSRINDDAYEEIIDINEEADYAEAEDDADMDDDSAGEMIETDIHDDSTCTFSKHKEPVFCIEFNPINTALVATGGQDDTAYVWNTLSGEEVIKCTGHKDSVVQVSWSHDGTMLASGDMAGLIQVWSVATKELIWSFEISDLEWMEWHYGTKVLFASDAEGMVWMWKIPSGDCKTFSNAGVAATCCHLLPGGSQLVTGYANGSLKIWDLASATCKASISGNDGHEDSITSLCALPEVSDQNNTFISGSVDGSTHLYNYKTGKLLKRFSCRSGVDDDDASVESISLCSSRPLAAAATSSGDVFIFDLRSQSCLHKINTDSIPVTQVQWHTDSPLLYASDVSGVVSLWDGRTGDSTAKFYGHIAEIHDLAVSKHGVIFASASEDGTAKVYSVSSDDSQS